MNVEIIVIGDELLIGQVTDTNSSWIARNLNKIGWEVMEITTVRDRRAEIISAIRQSFDRVDVVLMTGGLGPTKDDITKQTLCEYFGGKLIFDAEVQKNNDLFFERRGLQMNDSTRTQAMVPDSCTVIQNPVGTAPIMWFEKDGKVLVSMPGVPAEMQRAMTAEVLPRLRKRYPDHTAILHKTCLVKDFSESALSEFLSDFEAGLPASIKLAYLPVPGVIRLRLTARGENEEILSRQLDDSFSRLEDLLGKHIFCHRDATMAEALGLLLSYKGLTIATAESCTGGNIAHEITLIPGSSAYYKGSVVSYANEVKVQVLDVDPSTIEKHGVVSCEVVEQMAKGVRRLLKTDCAIATSGIAGPDGAVPGKPVGTVCIAVAVGDRIVSRKYCFENSRAININRVTHTALLQMISVLSE